MPHLQSEFKIEEIFQIEKEAKRNPIEVQRDNCLIRTIDKKLPRERGTTTDCDVIGQEPYGFLEQKVKNVQ